MNYLDILNLIFSILNGLCVLVMALFALFFVIGIFSYKKFPKTNKLHTYRVLVAARNEELVIANLIQSIKKTDYPRDKIEVFVVAHNCTDKTAEAAKAAGAIVYSYNNKNERTKGFALKYLLEQIKKDYGITSVDGYFVFDADNIVSKDYFTKMNDAFEYYKCNDLVTSFRNSKNFSKNIISGMYGISFALGCFSASRGRTLTNCSCRILGTGYVVPSQFFKDGWKYLTITEDLEFSTDIVLDGHKVYYCDEAMFYDEQPTSFGIMWRQRVRWAKGLLLIFKTRLKKIFAKLFSKDNKHRVSTYDLFINCLPITLVTFLLAILQTLLTFLSPCFGISLSEAFFGSGFSGSLLKDLIAPSGLLLTLLRNVVLTCLSTIIVAIMTFVVGHKRIKNVSFIKKVVFCLFYPFFVLTQYLIDLQALFTKSVEWKVIPHKDQTKIDHIS